MVRQGAGNEHEREETARLILAAARRLFMVHGYRGVSTRQVAEAVGLTQPALYHHFATKEELYVAVVLGEVARLRAGIERIVQREGAVAQRLEALARFLLTTVDYDFPLMYHDMGNELSVAAQERLGAAFYGGIIAAIATLFAEGQANNELRDPADGGLTPAAAAGLFMAFVAHFLNRPLVGQRQAVAPNAEATAALLVTLLLRGIGAPGATA